MVAVGFEFILIGFVFSQWVGHLFICLHAQLMHVYISEMLEDLSVLTGFL